MKISSSFPIESFEESIIDHLKIQLSHSEKIGDSECPYIKSGGETKLLLEHLEFANSIGHLSKYEEYSTSVWSLCHALWGYQEELEECEPSTHLSVMCRRNLFSEWLEDTVTDKDFLKKPVSKAGYLDRLLDLILCHKVSDACELAFNNDDANLSLLFAQLSSGPTVRQFVERQLASWQDVGADSLIANERLKMYMLVAGVSMLNSVDDGLVNVFEGLDWLKALAVHLWYICSPTSSITDALFAYENLFQIQEDLKPIPNYTNEYQAESNRPLFDVRYHILKLFSERSHPMEGLLNPATHTADPMDFRLSWLLL